MPISNIYFSGFLVYFLWSFMDMFLHSVYVRGGRQEYHGPMQKVCQLQSVVLVVGGVCADGVVVLHR